MNEEDKIPEEIENFIQTKTKLIAKQAEAEMRAFVRKCIAPGIRTDKPCGRWFIANRTDQIYCSPQCQSRSTTKAMRVRDKQTIYA